MIIGGELVCAFILFGWPRRSRDLDRPRDTVKEVIDGSEVVGLYLEVVVFFEEVIMGGGGG